MIINGYQYHGKRKNTDNVCLLTVRTQPTRSICLKGPASGDLTTDLQEALGAEEQGKGAWRCTTPNSDCGEGDLRQDTNSLKTNFK